jgi:hypothetical protein
MTMAKQNKREISRIGPRLTKDPNSVEFAWQTLALMKSFYESKKVSEDRWLRLVSEADQYRIYDRIPEDKPYGSLDAMLKAEIGKTEEQARLEVVKQAKNAEPPAPNGRPRKGMNVTPLSKRGNDRFVARIARDHPDILKRMSVFLGARWPKSVLG